MKHQKLPNAGSPPFRRVAPPSRRTRPDPNRERAAAKRFASACASLPGATVLDDAGADRVALSFGPRTEEICERLNAKGWIFLRAAERRDGRSLSVTFAGNRRAEATADELVYDLYKIFGEIELAETRAW